MAVHTPGPAEALFGFLRPRGGVLFCPDILVHAGRGKVGLLPDPYLASPKRTRATVKKLLRLKFRTICFGHGKPLTAQVRRSIAAALKSASK